MLKIENVSGVKTEKARADGKPSRQYYTVTFTSPDNPFIKPTSRTIFQNQSADGKGGWINSWRGGTPEQILDLKGQTIEGSIEVLDVPQYEFNLNGQTIKSNTFTAIRFGHEKLETVRTAVINRLARQNQNQQVAAPQLKEIV